MTLDSPVPQATLLRLWQALTKSLSSLVPITDVSEEMLVAEDSKEGVVGFVQVQSLSVRPRSWQILNLCTSTTAHGTSRVRSCSTACGTADSSTACSACTCACRLTIRS